MTIHEPDQREDRVPFHVTSRTTPYPERRRNTSDDLIPTILWSLGLAVGILGWLSMAPRQPPALDSLAIYTCDPPLVMRNRWNRPMAPMLYTCRSGNQVVYQRAGLPVGTNFQGWKACRNAGGEIKIWRHANPSPYGGYVFQTTCNGQIYADYKAQVASYMSKLEGGLIFISGLMILSITRLTVRIYRRLRHRSVRPI